MLIPAKAKRKPIMVRSMFVVSVILNLASYKSKKLNLSHIMISQKTDSQTTKLMPFYALTVLPIVYRL